jgi:hypothetical protein
VDAAIGDTVELLLNTGETIELNPEGLFVCKDHLYLQREDERIKFSDRVLLKLSAFIDYDAGRYYFSSGQERHPLIERQ